MYKSAKGISILPRCIGARILLLVAFTAVLFSTDTISAADEMRVIRNARLYAEPSSVSGRIRVLHSPEMVTRLSGQRVGNYVHVRTHQGEVGWVYSPYLAETPSAPPGGAEARIKGGEPFPTSNCVPPYNEEASEATDFDHSCGLTGNAESGSGEFVQNIAKNDLCEKSSASPITVSTLEDLQKVVDRSGLVYGSKFSGKGPPKDRSLLRNLPPLNSGLRHGEGDVVSYVGYLVEAHYMPQSESKPKKGKGGESVNCNSTEHVNADIHLALSDVKGRIRAKDADRLERLCRTISAEMIPHLRPGVWNMDTLNQVIDLERPVRVTGHLFFDGSHTPCRNGAPPANGNPRRIAEWEIHPIYAFEVCRFEAKNKCDPGKEAPWQALSEAEGITLEEEDSDE